ncbi:hypothetical protein QMP26_19440 [Enterocloster clostridioformis]
MDYQIHSYNKESIWNAKIESINKVAWPQFIQGEKVMRSYWGFMLGVFNDFQWVLTKNDMVIAVINSAPFKLGESDTLHENGIYWGLQQVTHNYYADIMPNTLLALQIVVNPQFRGKAVSYECLKVLKHQAYEKGFERIVIPLRPSLKHLYPLIDSGSYINWKNWEGYPYDPWLRVHIKGGGKIVKQCKGISIRASIQEWELWTGLHFATSGQYIVQGALNPVYADLSNNMAYYTQDNIWVVHWL